MFNRIKALILTYSNVDHRVTVHPNRKHSTLENHSDLIQKLLLQSRTVELLSYEINEKKIQNY